MSLLYVRLPRFVDRRGDGKKRFQDRVVDAVQLRLQIIQEFVQSRRNDLVDARVAQLGAQAAETPLGLVAGKPYGRTADGGERVARLIETITHGARKFGIENQKVGHLGRAHALTM